MATQPTDQKLPVVDPQYPIDYSSDEVPPTYKCGKCGASGCKLWRDYQTTLEHQSLYCARCACEQQDKDVSTMGDDGRRTSDFGGKTDQIGWLVPAVPTQANDSFWGYTAVPDEGVDWWHRVPTFAS